MWLIEALKLDFDVTVMTTGGWDLQALNGLLRNECRTRRGQRSYRAGSLFGAEPERCCSARSMLSSASRAKSPANTTFESALTTRPTGACLQFTLSQISVGIRRFANNSILHPRGSSIAITWCAAAYLKIAAAYGNPSGRDVLRDDIVVANSRWTAAIMKQYCGVDCAAVLYPPVSDGISP